MASPRTNTIVKRSAKEAFLRGFDDPVKFAWDFIGLDLHPAQETFLRESTRPGIKEANLAAGNRFGKGECAAVKMLWSAFYQKRNQKYAFDAQGKLRAYTAINTSISLDQASIVFDKAAGYAQNANNFKRFVHRVINSPFPTLELRPIPGVSTRGAEIWARSLSHGAKYLLGQNFQFLNIDEASLEPNGETILNDVIRMRMADSGGNIDTTSQPRGKNWWYYHVLTGFPDIGGQPNAVFDPEAYSQFGSSFDNPHIDHDHIKRSMKKMTPGQIKENILGQFSDENSFFPADKVLLLCKDQDYALPIPPGQELTWKTVQGIQLAEYTAIPSAVTPIYVMGVDLAAKQDMTCIIVLRVDIHPYQMVHFELFGKTEWSTVKRRVTAVHKEYRAWGYVDSTGPGGPVFDDLIGPDYGCDIDGFNFSGSAGNKVGLLVELQMAIQGRDFVFPYYGESDRSGNSREGTAALVDSLTHYQLEDKKLFTDPVMALALAIKAASDKLERLQIPVVTTPDMPTTVARKDSRSGLYIFRSADEDDDPEDFQLDRRYRHFTQLV